MATVKTAVDERVAETPLAQAADGATGARRRRRDHSGVPLLRGGRRQQRPVLGAGHHQLPRGLGAARHHRGRRLDADDRRRVRPVDRLDDRRRRGDHRDSRGAMGLAALAVRPARVRHRLPGRLHQRLDRGQDRPAVVHRDAGRPVHPARRDHRLHPLAHRAHPGVGPQGDRGAGLAGAAVRRRGRQHADGLAGERRADRDPRRRRSGDLRHLDVDRLVARADRRRDLHPAAHPRRQLDLRRGRRPERRAQRRRAGRGGQDRPVHVHRLRRDPVRGGAGARRRLGRHHARPAQGVRGDHRRGDRRLPA